MSKKKKGLYQVGRTADNRQVMGGVFRMYDTHGIPLFVIIHGCEKNNWVIGWHDFYVDAIKAGWTHKTIMMRLRADLFDSADRDYAEVILNRFETHYAA